MEFHILEIISLEIALEYAKRRRIWLEPDNLCARIPHLKEKDRKTDIASAIDDTGAFGAALEGVALSNEYLLEEKEEMPVVRKGDVKIEYALFGYALSAKSD